MAGSTDFWKNKETVAYFDDCKKVNKTYYNNYDEYNALYSFQYTNEFRGDEADAVKKFAEHERILSVYIRNTANYLNQLMDAVEDAYIDDMNECEDSNYDRKSLKDLKDWFKKKSKNYDSYKYEIDEIYKRLVSDYSDFGTYTDPELNKVEEKYDEICGYPNWNHSCYLDQVDNRFVNFIDHAEKIYDYYDIKTLIANNRKCVRNAVEIIQDGKNITPDISTENFDVVKEQYADWYEKMCEGRNEDIDYQLNNEVFDSALTNLQVQNNNSQVYKNTYGGDQGNLSRIYGLPGCQYKDLEYILKRYDRSKNLKTDKDVKALLDELNHEGCSYVAAVNILIQMYEGRENDFLKDFGVPMYRVDANGNKYLNYDEILLDYYLSQDDHVDNWFWGDTVEYDPNGVTPDEQIYRINRYLESKGLAPLDIEKRQSLSTEEIKELLENGDKVVINFYHGNLYKEDGTVQQHIDGGHAMVVTGVTDDGRLIVSSWGKKFYIDPDENSGRDKNTEDEYNVFHIGN
ncbi:hypothetical protein SAMN06296386_11381 [Lachnospiraceae bacterium]|nr:hypothetical protein SAMN06296386_11381 [Lachnospiraceae bacterium]